MVVLLVSIQSVPWLKITRALVNIKSCSLHSTPAPLWCSKRSKLLIDSLQLSYGGVTLTGAVNPSQHLTLDSFLMSQPFIKPDIEQSIHEWPIFEEVVWDGCIRDVCVPFNEQQSLQTVTNVWEGFKGENRFFIARSNRISLQKRLQSEKF